MHLAAAAAAESWGAPYGAGEGRPSLNPLLGAPHHSLGPRRPTRACGEGGSQGYWGRSRWARGWWRRWEGMCPVWGVGRWICGCLPGIGGNGAERVGGDLLEFCGWRWGTVVQVLDVLDRKWRRWVRRWVRGLAVPSGFGRTWGTLLLPLGSSWPRREGLLQGCIGRGPGLGDS